MENSVLNRHMSVCRVLVCNMWLYMENSVLNRHMSACRVLVCNRWLYMENSALSKVVGSLIPRFIPFWFVRQVMTKTTHAQGISRHSPDEVQHIGRLDLKAIRVYLGMFVLWV